MRTFERGWRQSVPVFNSDSNLPGLNGMEVHVIDSVGDFAAKCRTRMEENTPDPRGS